MLWKSFYILAAFIAIGPAQEACSQNGAAGVTSTEVVEDSTITKKHNRFRLMSGFLLPTEAYQISIESIREGGGSFVDIHYRGSNIKRNNPSTQWGLTIDIGILSPLQTPFFFPYFIMNSELRFLRNVYADIHLGFAVVASAGSPEGLAAFFAFPFAGARAGYIVPVVDHVSIEFEGGANSVIFFPALVAPYLSIGVSID